MFVDLAVFVYNLRLHFVYVTSLDFIGASRIRKDAMVWKIIKDFESCDFRFAKIFAFSGKYIMRIYGKLKMSFPALSEGNEKATRFNGRM